MFKISRQELQYYKNNFRSQYKDASMMDVSHALAIYVLVQVFGQKWFQQNITQSARTIKPTDPDFLPKPHQLSDGRWVYDPTYLHRVIMLADMIFNLQDVPGSDNVLGKMRDDSIEPYYAELVAGKLLRLRGTPFQYRVEGKGAGQDYDADILLPDGRVLPCEMKCKVQATDFSRKTLDEVLSRARKQLPPGKPGVIFLEIPQRWPGGFDVIPPDKLGGRQMMQLWINRKPQFWGGVEVNGGTAKGNVDVIAPSIQKLFRSSQRVAYVVVHTDARYDTQNCSPVRFLHLKRMYGFAEDSELVYAVMSRIYKNPGAICSADLPETVFEKKDEGSSWLRLIDV